MTGLRAALADRYDAMADRLKGDVAADFRRNAERWRSGRPAELQAWQLPAEFLPPDLDPFDRLSVDAAGQLTVVRRTEDINRKA